MQAAARVLQRFFRVRYRTKLLCQLSYNYNNDENDLISLERLQDLPFSRLVLLTCPVTHRLIACDAPAWAAYFLTSTLHPCSRKQMSPEDVWSCYLRAFHYLSDEQHKQFRSSGLRAVRKLLSPQSASVRIKPTSPLFHVTIFALGPVGPVQPNGKKRWKFEYALHDSRSSRELVSKRMCVELLLESSDRVSVH